MTLLILNRRPLTNEISGWLRHLDENLVLVTPRSAVPDLPYARTNYRDVIVVDDYDAPEVEELVLTLAKRYEARRILSTTEVDVLRAARVREKLGLPGQNSISALAYRDKFRMKSIIAAAGLAVAPMVAVHSASVLRDFAQSNDFPIVVKPTTGGGSVGVKVLTNHLTVEKFIEEIGEIASPSLMAESWIDGDFFTIDGLMAGGRVLQIWPSRTSPNLATVAELRSLTSWMLLEQDDVARRVRDFVTAAVRALPGPEEVTAFHAEVFHTKDDRLVFCEIACRPGGCGHVPIFEHTFGINLYAESLRGQSGYVNPAILTPQKPDRMGGFVWFPPQAKRLRRLPDLCPIWGVYRYTTTGQVGQVYTNATSVSDNIAQALITGTSDEGLEKKVHEVEAWWENAGIWEQA